MMISPQPETQQVPMPRATTAAWLVMPPRTVRMPWELCIPSMSSGLVSSRTRITFLPRPTHFITSSAENTTRPVAAPGEAGKPLPMGLVLFRILMSNWGWSSASNCLGSTVMTASSSVIMPSSTRSHAIFSAAAAVRLPLLVWSMKSFFASMVNSISCISR
ncbi:hypothetical protein SDC9_201090 [bioreactor metagenome]|uniref:Uncharacterized protein n=1 Tax=bioreactor metagenome TaxID=1076179 RepID=A0A645IQQ1_9ZZZZ